MGKGYKTEQYTVFVRSCGSRNLPALLVGVLTALAIKDKLIILVQLGTHTPKIHCPSPREILTRVPEECG